MFEIDGRVRNELTVGERIELRRRQRGLSRRVVAHFVGRSEEWLRLIERGKQPLDSLVMITRLAEVLRIEDFRELVDVPKRRARGTKTTARAWVEVFEQVLADHPAQLGRYQTWADGLTVDDLAAEIHACQQIWISSSSRFTQMQQRLPRVLAAARRYRWQVRDRTSSCMTLRAYHLARPVLTRIGADTMATIVADRAMETALGIDDLRWSASTEWHFANALLHVNRFARAQAFATTAAERMSATSAEQVHLRGALIMVAAKSAAYGHDRARADLLIGRAREAAQTLGGEKTMFGIGFGPVEIELARMEIALAHGDFAEVVRIAEEVEVTDRHPLTSRTRYHIAVACAFAHDGEAVAATLALERAADACPEELRYDEDARRILQRLVRIGNRRPRAALARLCALAQLA